MATALISVLTDRPIRNDVAMTGEITLRGRVLPVGGLKEKALGAARSGIRKIIIPEKNRKDLAEIPQNVKRRLKFIPVRHMEDVMPHALLDTLLEGQTKTKKTTKPRKKPGKQAAHVGRFGHDLRKRQVIAKSCNILSSIQIR
jgi:ATP-dependent Lon protease